MLYSMTDKLNFNAPPIIEIKGKKITVNNDAVTVLKLLDVVNQEGELMGIKAVMNLLFSEKDRKYIESLKLNIEDYSTVAKTALELALGTDPDEEDEQGK